MALDSRTRIRRALFAGACAVALAAAWAGSAAELALTVVDGATGDAVAQAEVRARVDGALLGVVTDTAGACVVPYPEGGVARQVALTVRADGYVPVMAEWRVGSEAAPSEYALRLQAAKPIGGIVEDTSGAPLPGAEITVYVEAPARGRERVAVTDYGVATDEAGRWRCEVAPPDASKIRLRVQSPGQTLYKTFTYTASGTRTIASLQAMTDVIAIARRFDVAGSLATADGKPPRRADLLLWAVDSDSTGAFTARARPDGAFVLKNCKEGEALLLVHAEGCAVDLRRITFAADMAPLSLELAPGAVIRGRVIDSAQNPLADADVAVVGWRGHKLQLWNTRTDAEGRFVWKSAPPGEAVEFSCAKPGYQGPAMPVLTAGDGENQIVLGSLLRLHGTVVDAETNERIPAFRLVRGVDWGGSGTIDWMNNRPEPGVDGEYAMMFDDTYPAYALRIEADGYLPAVSRRFLMEEGEQEFSVALKRGVGLGGVVRSPDGAPVAGADVALLSATRGIRIRDGVIRDRSGSVVVRTDEEGRFQFQPEADALAAVAVHDTGFAVALADALAASPGLPLEAWGRVKGVVRAGTAPVVDAYVVVRRLQVPESSPGLPPHLISIECRAITDENGAFSIEQAPVGPVSVAREVDLLDGSVCETHGTTIRIAAGQAATADIGGTGRPVTGRVALPAGAKADLSRCRASIRPEDVHAASGPYIASVGVDGALRAEDVPAGRYVLDLVAGNLPYHGATAQARHAFDVPAMEDGRLDEPLDLGAIELAVADMSGPDAVASDFTAQTFTGDTVHLTQFRGKYVLLDFWASWCQPCRRESPQLVAVFDEFGADERFVMLGLCLDEEMETAKAYAEGAGLVWPQCFLGEWRGTSVPDRFGVEGIPAIILLDPDGRIVARDLSGKAIAEAVRAVLQEPPGPADTGH
ncbi:MAG: carboxypeptidase regulatory-like domain-containing protein [Candidatus Hydrogenedentes bacterium]|nr:carboxypeptidase regulatory-like domain-containing protein [Candidatus Hydrogenedentota bacterium]